MHPLYGLIQFFIGANLLESRDSNITQCILKRLNSINRFACSGIDIPTGLGADEIYDGVARCACSISFGEKIKNIAIVTRHTHL